MESAKSEVVFEIDVRHIAKGMRFLFLTFGDFRFDLVG